MNNANEETFTEGTIVMSGGEQWLLLEAVRVRLIPEWKCPQCGSSKGTWFDRSFTLDDKGNEIEPMCDRCSDCGKRV